MPINTTKAPPIKDHNNHLPQFPNNSRNGKNKTIKNSNKQANSNDNRSKCGINNKTATEIIKKSTTMLTKT